MAKRIDVLADLQGRILGQSPPLPETPDDLVRALRGILRNAVEEGLLKTPRHQIFHLLKHAQGKEPTHQVIIGGEKNQPRTRDRAHFEREDGAWFDFSITVAHRRGQGLELIGYNFEIRFDTMAPRFVRFDLNPPGHTNEARDLRSHLHPGSDELSVPSPFMSPLEVLHLMLYELRPRNKNKLRAED